VSTRAGVVQFATASARRDRIQTLIRSGAKRRGAHRVRDGLRVEVDGLPAGPADAGLPQFQQMDSLIEELKR
jgi:hypothetical protein